MSWLDFALLAIVVVSMVLGLARGFVHETLSLVVWAGAFWLALHYTPQFSDVLTDTVVTPWLRLAVAFASLFLITLLVGALFVFLFTRAVRKSGLGGPDRVLGVGFGFVRGVLVVMILVYAAQLTPLTKTQWWQSSALIAHVQNWVSWMHGLWSKQTGMTGEINGGIERNRREG